MLSPTMPVTAGVAGCEECAAAAASCSAPCSAPVTIERERDWLWIRTKMPVCIWPETCLLGCSALEHHLVSYHHKKYIKIIFFFSGKTFFFQEKNIFFLRKNIYCGTPQPLYDTTTWIQSKNC